MLYKLRIRVVMQNRYLVMHLGVRLLVSEGIRSYCRRDGVRGGSVSDVKKASILSNCP